MIQDIGRKIMEKIYVESFGAVYRVSKREYCRLLQSIVDNQEYEIKGRLVALDPLRLTDMNSQEAQSTLEYLNEKPIRRKMKIHLLTEGGEVVETFDVSEYLGPDGSLSFRVLGMDINEAVERGKKIETDETKKK